MPLFLWKPSYEIGVPEIDAQHRALVRLINQLFDAMKEDRGQAAMSLILDELFDYVQLHFTTEENCMRDHGYGDLQQHVHEHLDLTAQVVHYRKLHGRGERVPTQDVLKFLCEWLRDHITSSDRGFGEFLATAGSVEPP